jgi:hypothetical protein
MQIQNLIGFILPPIIDMINVNITSSKMKYWVSMLVCVIIGVISNLDKIGNTSELLSNIAVIFTTAQITYHTYWEKSQVRNKLIK